MLTLGGRALNGLGAIPGYQPQSNSEYLGVKRGSQTAGDNVRSREGNNPDHRIRSLNVSQWRRMWIYTDNEDVGLEAATI